MLPRIHNLVTACFPLLFLSSLDAGALLCVTFLCRGGEIALWLSQSPSRGMKPDPPRAKSATAVPFCMSVAPDANISWPARSNAAK